MNSDVDSMLDTDDAPATSKKTKKAKVKKAKATNGAAGAAKVKKTKAAEPAPSKKDKAAKGKKAAVEAKPKPKKVASDVSTTQPEDAVVLKAVRKLKEATLASDFASGLGVHRRVIRAQLHRLAKDKANGVKMKKDGTRWLLENTAKG